MNIQALRTISSFRKKVMSGNRDIGYWHVECIQGKHPEFDKRILISLDFQYAICPYHDFKSKDVRKWRFIWTEWKSLTQSKT